MPQGPFPVPRLIASVLVAATTASAQAPSKESGASRPLPSFEVASVKLNNDPQPQRNGVIRPDRFAQLAVNVDRLITMAYARRPFDRFDIEGGPDWMRSDLYDVNAKIEDGAGTLEQL